MGKGSSSKIKNTLEIVGFQLYKHNKKRQHLYTTSYKINIVA